MRPFDTHVTYREFAPDPSLQPFIYCYWELRTNSSLQEDFRYRVVADGCIDIFFEAGNPHESYVMGFCRKYTEFAIGNSFRYVGIRFLPTMFPQLFGISASVLSNRFVALADIGPELALFTSSIEQDGSMDSMLQSFDDFFKRRINKIKLNEDSRLYDAIHIILRTQGVLNVERDLVTGISPRQLRRLFDFYIGDSAKTFARVVRFQNVLRAKPSVRSLRENKLFFDAGYFDQAHFIKEFRSFYGVTPTKAFGR